MGKRRLFERFLILFVMLSVLGVMGNPVAVSAKGLTKAQKKLVNNPSESYIVECLSRVPGILEIAAATEDRDPNGQLHKAGGYTSAVYFSYEAVDQDSVYGDDLIGKGTDAGGQIEVYANKQDAKKRDKYLASLDGTILTSGSHKVVGTVVVRTSHELTASEQSELESNIIAELTRTGKKKSQGTSDLAKEQAETTQSAETSLEDRVKELEEQLFALEAENASLKEENAKLHSEIESIQEAKGEQEAEGEEDILIIEEEPSEILLEEEVADKGQLQSGIVILREYTLSDSIGWYTRRFLVVQNTTSDTVNVYTSSLAYDEGGSLLGLGEGSVDALGSGCISVIIEHYETSTPIASYDTTLETEPSSYYKSVIQNLSYEALPVQGAVVVTVTNQGGEKAEFVEGYVLFFKDGAIVDYDSQYFTDSDSEIKPGASIRKQLETYEDFDEIEFYLTGRRTQW